MGMKALFGSGFLILVIALVFLLPGSVFTDGPSFDNSEIALVQDTLLHYRAWSPAVEETSGHVLLVHGLGGSTFSWRYTAPFLAEAGYYVVAVDLPGFGFSDRSRNLDHSQQHRAVLLWDLLTHHLHIGQPGSSTPWHLVGHSMGGGTITAMTAQHPDRVQSLTYAAGAVYNRPPSLAGKVLAVPGLNRLIGAIFRLIFLRSERIEGVLESAYGRPPSPEELSGYLEPLLLPGTEMSLIDITASQGNPVSEYVEAITAPALLLWGANDTWVPPSQGERLASELDSARLLVHPSSGHCPMETEPEWFNTQLLHFLRETTRPSYRVPAPSE